MLIHDELQFDRRILSEEYGRLLKNLNSDQRQVYDTIMATVNSNQGGVFFVYGYVGTGKTFV